MATKTEAHGTMRAVRRLAEAKMDEPVVVTVYVNLDPSQFGTARERDTQTDSLLHELRSLDMEALSHDGRTSLESDISKIEGWIRDDMDPQGLRAVGIFASSAANLFEAIGLPSPAGPAAGAARIAHLRTLLHAVPRESWCVFLVNRRTARILRGNREGLDEVAQITDDVHGQHDQGGWSQARYERSVENEVMDHIRNGCGRLFEEFGERPFDKLLLGCAQELRPDVESKLHPYLTERLVDCFEGEIEHAGPNDIMERVRPLMDMDDSRSEAAIIERLSEQLGRNERAAAGLDDVLRALNERSVETLLMAPGFVASGVVCPQCDWLATSGSECPVDRTRLDRVDDVVEHAIRAAVLQSADVREVSQREPDAALGGRVAALLRFDVAT